MFEYRSRKSLLRQDSPAGAILILGLFVVLATATNGSQAQSNSINSRPCPYDCDLAGLSRQNCRDWRVSDQCFVEILPSPSAPTYKFCRKSNGELRMRKRCLANRGEETIAISDLIGPQGESGRIGDTGPTGNTGATGPIGATGADGASGASGPVGATGPAGPQGPAGADGSLRIYGDGSRGALTISADATFSDSNPQYTDFTVAAGVILTVPSGTVIRCSGTFHNLGTILVSPGLRDYPRFAEAGNRLSTSISGGPESPGGNGGKALPPAVSRAMLRLGLLSAGNGYRESSDTGGDGGGSFTVLCAQGVINSGTIAADGLNSAVTSGGGGGGGFVILASGNSVLNQGSIQTNGGNGGPLLSSDANFTGYGPGGGGGGGVIHLIAPVVTSSGTLQANGGNGGAAGGVGSITGLAYIGGGGGGGSGGDGGAGGAVNPGNIGNDSTSAGENGAAGQIIQTLANPESLF